MFLLYFVLLLLSIYFIIFHLRARKFRQLMKVAGDHTISTLPIFGIAHHFLGSNQTRMQALQLLGLEATKAGGLLAGWFGPLPYVVISDAEVAEVVLKECLDKDFVMKLVRHVIGDGLIVAPLSIWRTRRRVLVPTFVSKNLKEFVKVFSKQSRVMVEQLKKQVGKGPFPIWNYLASNNMDTVCEAVFGIKMHVQENPEHPFLIAFNKVSSIMASRMCQPWLHSNVVYKLLPQYQTLNKGTKVLYDTIDAIIEQKQKDLEDVNNKNAKEGLRPFLELLIESSAQESGPYNKQELREETLTLTIAGTDTSAASAAFVLLALSKYQDVQDKVHKEINEVLGDSSEECTMEDLKKLTYMDAAIKESMRLYTPVPVVLRHVTHDVVLPTGVTLPAGCGVLMNIWALHRNKKYWGEDAEIFRPERFLDTPLKHPAQYMPFSYGPRNCPGARYAMFSIKTALATLLKRYRILPGAGEPCLSFELMMKDANDFPVELQLRNQANRNRVD